MTVPSQILDPSQDPTRSLPPAQPTYILRGHTAPIHTLLFYRKNLRLLSGDAEGWVVVWALTTKRPVAVWKAHGSTVLGAAVWVDGVGERIITHGRDSRILVWQLGPEDEDDLSTQLPVEDAITPRKQPWLLHSFQVPTLNFCSFTSCSIWRNESSVGRTERKAQGTQDIVDESSDAAQSTNNTKVELKIKEDSLLLAFAGAEESSITIYALPSEKQIASIPAPSPAGGKTGMVMSLRMVYKDVLSLAPADIGASSVLTVVAGYESGRVCVFSQVSVQNTTGGSIRSSTAKGLGTWQITYTARPHEQPLLSLDIAPSHDVFFTSGADAIISRHPLHSLSSKTSLGDSDETDTIRGQPTSTTSPQSPTIKAKEVKTRHSGQQGLCVRSDGRLFATAGWDGRARVYSVKTMKELAVLKWHKEGCYAAAFADVGGGSQTELDHEEKNSEGAEVSNANARHETRLVRVGGSRGMTVRDARTAKVQETHWLAIGSKDAKISLWDIY